LTKEREAFLEHVSAMGRELAPDTVVAIARSLWRGGIELPANPRVRYLAQRLLELSPAAGLNSSEAGWALLAAQKAAGDVAQSQTLSLVWTGPDTNVPVRRNDEALYEVVASAESELLVVSFVVYRVPRIREGLVAAVNRGVSVKLVFEFRDAEGEAKEGGFDPMQALGELPDEIRVLEWPLTKRPVMQGRRGYIHAKCAVADREVAVVSSANLTLYGLESNMELGVLIRGGTLPRRICEHFEALEAAGELAPMPA
jgi:phosphatidylserine/phosphatidylglycerophosphate/cardiolipin synthase-like enzyme